jgi:ATP-dependent Zn protease
VIEAIPTQEVGLVESDENARGESTSATVARLLDAIAPITAQHEAAHVVAAALVGGQVKHATIAPRIENGAVVDGSITWSPPANLTLREHAIVSLAAGVMSGHETEQDTAEVRALADQQIEVWRTDARELVERHRERIETVAAALLEHGSLGEDALRELLNDGGGR